MQAIYRQGDLTFIRTGEARHGEPTPSAILALGEESGHWHQVVAGSVIDTFTADGRTLDVLTEARIEVRPESHAHRHEPLTLPPGRYTIPGQPDARSKWLGQREYTPHGIRGSAD